MMDHLLQILTNWVLLPVLAGALTRLAHKHRRAIHNAQKWTSYAHTNLAQVDEILLKLGAFMDDGKLDTAEARELLSDGVTLAATLRKGRTLERAKAEARK